MSLTLEHVSLAHAAETIIADVSLAFARGTMNVLLGPTLAGKTFSFVVLALEVPLGILVALCMPSAAGPSARRSS